MIRRTAFLLLIALALPASPRVHADIVRHTVKTGDTLPALGKLYYGDEKKALYIARTNNLAMGATLPAGKILKVPFVTRHTVGKKDTFRSLASRYLKDSGKAAALAALNGMGEKAALTRGTTVRIPFEIFHRVEDRDTLAGIAEIYLGDAKEAVFLKEYNRLKNMSDIVPGRKLAIPLLVDRRSAVPVKKGTAPASPPALRKKDISAAIALYERGEYRGSLEKFRALLADAAGDAVPPDLRRTIHYYMALDYLAIEEIEAAKGECQRILILDPAFRPSPGEAPPRLLDLLDSVRPSKKSTP